MPQPDAHSSRGPDNTTICAIMTVRNRAHMTVNCVRAVLDEVSPPKVTVSVIVVDDGSTDGTRCAILQLGEEEQVKVIAESGDLYWAAGMARAEAAALRAAPDYVLWLNDDVSLDPGFLQVLLGASRASDGATVVGATRDPLTGATTYSGLRRRGWHPMSFEVIEPTGSTVEVDAFNGNVVLVPRAVIESIGGVDGCFAHAYADLDYGLRLGKAGRPAVLAPKSIGACARNPTEGTWLDARLPVAVRIRLLHSRKGAPPSSTARFLRRHGGVAWPLFLLSPYARIGRELVIGSIARGPS